MKFVFLGTIILAISLNVFKYTSGKVIDKPCGYGTAEYVLIIGIDGLGGVYLRNAMDKLPGLRSFFEEGSYTTSARPHNPTLSGPNWASILTGMRPEETGINNNYWTPANGRETAQQSQNHVEPISGEGIPETMFKAAKKQNNNIKTYMSFSWDWLVHLSTPSSVDHLFRGGWQVEANTNWKGPLICPAGNFTEQQCGNITDYRTFNDTLRAIGTLQPNLMFSYFGLLDQVGHDIYWGSPEYYEALVIADNYVQDIITALNNTNTTSGERMLDKTLVMVTTDHGGFTKFHGFCLSMRNVSRDPNNTICASFNIPAVLNIPVLLRGPGIKQKFNMENNTVTNRDVAATALNALGLNKGEYMTGRVLEEAYQIMGHCPQNKAKNERSQSIIFLIILCFSHLWFVS